MSCEEGNERPEVYHDEEWQASNSGRLPHLWYKNVQNWKGLGRQADRLKGLDVSDIEMSSPLFRLKSHKTSYCSANVSVYKKLAKDTRDTRGDPQGCS
jgi:hypothetical protein